MAQLHIYVSSYSLIFSLSHSFTSSTQRNSIKFLTLPACYLCENLFSIPYTAFKTVNQFCMEDRCFLKRLIIIYEHVYVLHTSFSYIFNRLRDGKKKFFSLFVHLIVNCVLVHTCGCCCCKLSCHTLTCL